MKFTKEQQDYIKHCGEHFELLTGGRGHSKTKAVIEDMQQEIDRLNNEIMQYDKCLTEMTDDNKRLNNIINELEESAREIVRVGKNKGYQYVENFNELKTKEEIYDFIEFYYGLYLLEQLDKLKELKEDNK